MASESTVFGLSALAVVVGLAILLYGAYSTTNPITFSGGVVVLAGLALMTAYIAAMSEPEGANSGH